MLHQGVGVPCAPLPSWSCCGGTPGRRAGAGGWRRGVAVLHEPGSSLPQSTVFPLSRSCEKRKCVFTWTLADKCSLGWIWTSYWFFTPASFETSAGEVVCSCRWCPEWSGLGTAAWSQCLVTITVTLLLSDHRRRINKLLLLIKFFFFLQKKQTNSHLFSQTRSFSRLISKMVPLEGE